MKGQLSRTVRKAGCWAAMPTRLPDYLANALFYLTNDTHVHMEVVSATHFWSG
jgi:hypothetical protein